MERTAIKFTYLKLTNDNINTIADIQGVYMFVSKSSVSGGNSKIKIGFTKNLQRTSIAFYDYIQTTEIKDEELFVCFHLCEDKESCYDISNKLNFKYQNALPADLINVEF